MMEESQIMQLWKSYDARLEQSLSLNTRNFNEIRKMKASSALRPLKSVRWLGIAVGILWSIIVGALTWYAWTVSAYFFVVSAVIHLIITAIAVMFYIRHLMLIDQFDNSQAIVEAQEKLVILRDSNLRVMGILFLQLPVFSTFYINMEWIIKSPVSFWAIQVPFVLIQAILGIWLFRNLNSKNVDKKWFSWFVHKGEFESIRKAMGLLNEASEIKRHE
jgi:cobalamin synthase